MNYIDLKWKIPGYRLIFVLISHKMPSETLSDGISVKRRTHSIQTQQQVAERVRVFDKRHLARLRKMKIQQARHPKRMQPARWAVGKYAFSPALKGRTPS
ncbi:Uncharacterised protein [Neisseria gonorrhoeae]|uniref:Uncharacterized protein n=1 Tax=Neisseria gonorrhoeae TaxID=485 RepID=A0A378W1S2_NEIGO|nr:Uncharacterised protein [Neisseria gonorrhoeae]